MAAGTLLPVHQRFINGVPIPTNRRTLRLKEKYVIVLVFVTFVIFCFGTFFFLPDLREVVSVDDMRRQFRDAGHEMFVPRADLDELPDNGGGAALPIPDSAKRKKGGIIKHDPKIDFDLHVIEDRAKILQKIEEAREQERILLRMRTRLNISLEKKAQDAALTEIRDTITNEKVDMSLKSKLASSTSYSSSNLHSALNADSEGSYVNFKDGAPKDPDIKMQRDFVRKVCNQ